MTELPYRPAHEWTTAARAGLSEVFGEDTYTSRLLLGRVLGNTTLDGLGVIDMTPDTQQEYGLDSEPRYAEQAIRTNDPAVITELLGEAASRLESVIPAEWVTTSPEEAATGAKRLYVPHRINAVSDEVLGGLHIFLSPAKTTGDDR